VTSRKSATTRTGGISDEAVKKATGRTWEQWFRILDAAGARKMKHKDIALSIDKKFPEIGGWWCQMVTVGYEQARGIREKHQTPDGYKISGSKVINAPVKAVFNAWQDEKTRRRWLPDAGFTIRKATPHKSMRITWVDGKTSVDVNFYPKGNGKAQISLQHTKLSDAKAAEKKKAYWSKQLDRLKSLLEGA
jgi:hypothetical protein